MAGWVPGKSQCSMGRGWKDRVAQQSENADQDMGKATETLETRNIFEIYGHETQPLKLTSICVCLVPSLSVKKCAKVAPAPLHILASASVVSSSQTPSSGNVQREMKAEAGRIEALGEADTKMRAWCVAFCCPPVRVFAGKGFSKLHDSVTGTPDMGVPCLGRPHVRRKCSWRLEVPTRSQRL